MNLMNECDDDDDDDDMKVISNTVKGVGLKMLE